MAFGTGRNAPGLERRGSHTALKSTRATARKGTHHDKPTGILHPEKGAETGVTASALAYDDVVKLFFSVKPEYRKNGVWLMNDETALALRTLKDNDGNYLWNHCSDTILGKRVEISEYMPGVESGKAPVLFGDFRYYWIVSRSSVTVKPITEKSPMIRLAISPASSWMAGSSAGRL